MIEFTSEHIWAQCFLFWKVINYCLIDISPFILSMTFCYEFCDIHLQLIQVHLQMTQWHFCCNYFEKLLSVSLRIRKIYIFLFCHHLFLLWCFSFLYVYPSFWPISFFSSLKNLKLCLQGNFTGNKFIQFFFVWKSLYFSFTFERQFHKDKNSRLIFSFQQFKYLDRKSVV